MNNIGEKYLPIGTVVLLKGGTKRVMITGFCAVEEGGNVEYDYSGCLYPEGFLSFSQICLFNHDQIDKIFFKGFIDDEEIEFKKNLNQLLNIENEKKEQQEKILEMNDDVKIIEEPDIIEEVIELDDNSNDSEIPKTNIDLTSIEF